MSDVEQPKTANGSPPAWSASELGPDVSLHLDTAQKIATTVSCIDGEGRLEYLTPGSVGAWMFALERELQTVSDILEQGDAS